MACENEDPFAINLRCSLDLSLDQCSWITINFQSGLVPKINCKQALIYFCQVMRDTWKTKLVHNEEVIQFFLNPTLDGSKQEQGMNIMIFDVVVL